MYYWTGVSFVGTLKFAICVIWWVDFWTLIFRPFSLINVLNLSYPSLFCTVQKAHRRPTTHWYNSRIMDFLKWRWRLITKTINLRNEPVQAVHQSHSRHSTASFFASYFLSSKYFKFTCDNVRFYIWKKKYLKNNRMPVRRNYTFLPI